MARSDVQETITRSWTLRRCACSVVSVDEAGPPLPTPCEVEGAITFIKVVAAADVERLLGALREIATDFALTDNEAIRDIIVSIDAALEKADG